MMIGRNDQCWCGSKKKFKKCHGLNQGINSLPSSELDMGKARKHFYETKKCLAMDISNCSENIIQAHTISKSSSLSPIAVKGHVLTFVKAIKQTYEKHWIPEKIGIKNATTLQCFCSKHDNEIFREIDSLVFNFSCETAFLLSYRTLAKEYYEKELSVKLLNLCEHFLRSGDEFRYVSLSSAEKASLRSLKAKMKAYDTILRDKDFSKFCYKVFELPESLKITCAAATFVDVDINGNEIQNLTDLKINKSYVCINTIYNNGKPYTVMGWDSDSNPDVPKLIESIEKATDPIKQLTYYIFINVGNICMNPDWYHGLSDATKATLTQALELGGVGHIPRVDLFPLSTELDVY